MADADGLSLAYRIGWKIRRTLFTVFGPAQLGTDDPRARLDRERAAKIAEIRRARGES